jgi:hypothetical protein
MTPVAKICVPPPLAVAEIVSRYVSFGNSVGSKTARVAGGVPLPLASVTGAEGSWSWYVTLQEEMLWPAGGVKVALIGTGLVTLVPSGGEGLVMAGAGAVPPVGVDDKDHGTRTAFDSACKPITEAVTCAVSVPALSPT